MQLKLDGTLTLLNIFLRMLIPQVFNARMLEFVRYHFSSCILNFFILYVKCMNELQDTGADLHDINHQCAFAVKSKILKICTSSRGVSLNLDFEFLIFNFFMRNINFIAISSRFNSSASDQFLQPEIYIFRSRCSSYNSNSLATYRSCVHL